MIVKFFDFLRQQGEPLMRTRPFMKTMPSDPHRIRSAYPILFDPLTAHTTAYEGRLDETAEFPIH